MKTSHQLFCNEDSEEISVLDVGGKPLLGKPTQSGGGWKTQSTCKATVRVSNRGPQRWKAGTETTEPTWLLATVMGLSLHKVGVFFAVRVAYRVYKLPFVAGTVCLNLMIEISVILFLNVRHSYGTSSVSKHVSHVLTADVTPCFYSELKHPRWNVVWETFWRKARNDIIVLARAQKQDDGRNLISTQTSVTKFHCKCVIVS